jgi:hypothetical protein
MVASMRKGKKSLLSPGSPSSPKMMKKKEEEEALPTQTKTPGLETAPPPTHAVASGEDMPSLKPDLKLKPKESAEGFKESAVNDTATEESCADESASYCRVARCRWKRGCSWGK